jgi:hypothetical protein
LFDDAHELIDLAYRSDPIRSIVIDFFQALGVRLLHGRVVGDLALLEAALLQQLASHPNRGEGQQDRGDETRGEGKARVTLVRTTATGQPPSGLAQSAGGL